MSLPLTPIHQYFPPAATCPCQRTLGDGNGIELTCTHSSGQIGGRQHETTWFIWSFIVTPYRRYSASDVHPPGHTTSRPLTSAVSTVYPPKFPIIARFQLVNVAQC